MTTILVICTGNICRSPIAEGLLRQALSGRFGELAPVVSSAGTSGLEG
jgi:protein-tyrosine phosphatase